MEIDIKRQYIIAGDREIGVVLDIKTSEQIEELLENCGLARYMEDLSQ